MNKQMRYVKVALRFIGAVIACSLITALSNLVAPNGEIASVSFIAVLFFIWHLSKDPNRKFFS
jgi:hypothetical protein